jgi:hypothetical protein
MANSYTNRLKKRLPAVGDYDWDDEWYDNEKIDDVVAGALLTRNRVISGGEITPGGGLYVTFGTMIVEVAGIRYSIPGSGGMMLANSLNYLYVDVGGSVNVHTLPPSGDYVPLAVVDTDATSVLRIGDLRPFAPVAQPGRNLIINSGFGHNFDVYAADGVATLANGVYGHSMWLNQTGSTQKYAIDGSGNIDLDAMTLGQKNDLILAADGEQVTFSVQDGSVQVYGLGISSWTTVTQATPLTWTLSASGNNGWLYLKKSGTVTFREPKLELGPTSSRYVPDALHEVEALCAPYMFKTYLDNIKPGAVSTHGRLISKPHSVSAYFTYFNVTFPHRMRATPSVTVYADATGAAGYMSHVIDGNIAASVGQTSEGSTSFFNTVAMSVINTVSAHLVADARYYA